MMKIAKYLVGFSVVVLLLLATVTCVNVEEIKIGTVHNIEFQGLHGNVVTLKAVVPVENPNGVDLKIKDADLTVWLGDKELGKVKQLDEILILKKSNQEYPLVINVEITNVMNIASVFMNLSGGIHDLRLRGTVVIKAFVYNKKINIQDLQLVK
jgi:LEA14-like dessication related protein